MENLKRIKLEQTIKEHLNTFKTELPLAELAHCIGSILEQKRRHWVGSRFVDEPIEELQGLMAELEVLDDERLEKGEGKG